MLPDCHYPSHLSPAMHMHISTTEQWEELGNTLLQHRKASYLSTVRSFWASLFTPIRNLESDLCVKVDILLECSKVVSKLLAVWSIPACSTLVPNDGGRVLTDPAFKQGSWTTWPAEVPTLALQWKPNRTYLLLAEQTSSALLFPHNTIPCQKQTGQHSLHSHY